MRHASSRTRRGSILPLMVMSLTALIGFVALAIDVSVVAVSRNQCQNAADAAAMTGARTLNGSTSANISQADANARAVAQANFVMGRAPADADISLQFGAYHYDPSTSTFSPQIPAVAPDTTTLAQATVNRSQSALFSLIFGVTNINVTASAMAAHRPRDVCMVLDYSGSMNNESDLWNNASYLGPLNNSPNNTDPNVPLFAQYSASNANMVCVTADPRVGKCNITQPVLGIPALVSDFYSNSRGNAATGAFAAAPNSYATAPAGDGPLFVAQNRGTSYAQTVQDVVANTIFDLNFELDGYAAYSASLAGQTDYNSAPFNGYTQGPAYFGKTFMLWPPDPRAGPVDANTAKGFLEEFGYSHGQVTGNSADDQKIRGVFQVTGAAGSQDWPWPGDGVALQAYLLTVPTPALDRTLLPTDTIYQQICRLHFRPFCDWRGKFFTKSDGVTPVDDNSLIWSSAGNWRDPVTGGSTHYIINYAAILNWIKNTGPNPFPDRLRGGRILYYDSIPSDVPASAYTWTNDNSNISDANMRFWKEYIDYVLGVWRDPYGHANHPQSPACSMGPDFAWGAVQVTARPSGRASGHALPNYMDYQDNPKRPRHRGWFGPMTMIQFMSDTGLFPGTAHDISMISAKLGIASALTDISNNHPNDLVAMLMYSRPHYSGDPPNQGQFATAQVPLSHDYVGMQQALFFPPNSSSNDLRPWDADAVQTPRASGDFASETATSFGFMLAYNQFSQNRMLTGSSGGGGRRGAQRLVVLETDGMANVDTVATLTNAGAYQSYYNILPGQSFGFSAAGITSGVLNAAQSICNLDTDSPPGYSTGRKPAIIHCVAFGAIFEPTAAGVEPTAAMNLLRQVSAIGNTGFPTSVTDTGSPDFYKLCTGTLDQRQLKLSQAFSKIMDDGIAVSMIQ